METGAHPVLRLCPFVILLCQQLTATAGLALDEINEYRSAAVEDNVTLSCRNGPEAVETTVTWWYQKIRTSADHEDVFVAGKLVNGFRTKCSIDSSNKNEFNLIIFNLTMNDAGLYTCIEDGGFGTRHLIHLRVSEATIMAPTSPLIDSQFVKDEHTTGMADLLPGFTDTLQSTGGMNGITSVTIIAAAATIAILVVAAVVIAKVFIVKRRHRSSQRDKHVLNALLHRRNPESKRQFWREIIRKVIKEKVNTIRVAIADEKVRDTSALTIQPKQLKKSIQMLADHIRERGKPDVIVGLDSRGFALGPLVAGVLNLPFVAVRNGGRVVEGTLYEEHQTRTGQAIVKKLHQDALPPVPDGRQKLRVVVVDDELATGGSLVATVKLLRQIDEVEVTECVILAELLNYNGREQMSRDGYNMPEVFSLIEVDEQRQNTDDAPLWKFQINDAP